MTTIDERVAAGAKWLDEYRPGWWQRINLDTLDLGLNCGCVLGQLDGDFWSSPEVKRTEAAGARVEEFAAPLGLYADPEEDASEWQQYDALTDAWRTLILARRETHGPCPPDCTCGGTYRPAVVDAETGGEVL